MGTYQAKLQSDAPPSVSTSKNHDTSNIVVSLPPEGGPPVFGPPMLDNESYLASIATKVGVPISASPRSVSTGSPTPPPIAEVEIDLSPSAPSKETSPEPEPEGHTRKSKQEDLIANSKSVPIVFHWDHGGNEVYVSGSFNDWKRIPMNRSRDNFSTIVELPQGTHEYKFYVDGKWLHDTNETSKDNGFGTYNNIVTITDEDFAAFTEQFDTSSLHKRQVSPSGTYDQIIPPRSVTAALPPHLPPLLQQTILNQEPPSEEHPTLLPEPNHVILNHLYALSIKDGVLVMATTNRYKEKYITTLMYRPI